MFPYEHLIGIEKDSKTPVYRQIAISVTKAVRNGVIKPGTILPGSRELAGILGVHRKTVTAAYEELASQDWITIVPRKHAVVSESIPLLNPQKWNPVRSSYEHDLTIPFKTADNKADNEISFPLPELIIDDGHPDIRLSPIDALLKTYRSLTSRKYTAKHVIAGTVQGTLQLRSELVTYLSETRGLNLSADNLLITHGAQMSIYLTAQLLLGPGSTVIMSRPDYPLAKRVFEQTGARVPEVEADENGIRTDAIEMLCKKHRINAVYVIPHHHYPTTVTLSAERRMKLLELSAHYQFAVIEDDYDYDYHYTSSPYLPLASAGHNGNVLYIGSFSKVLDPSIRIGFMAAPKNFTDQCTALRKLIDAGGDGYMQNALASLIREGELRRHLKKARKCYHQRRDLLDALLKTRLSEYVSYTLPSGGMAVWVRLKPDYPVSALNTDPRLRIIRTDMEQNAFRFGFASMNEKELTQAVGLLENCLQRMK